MDREGRLEQPDPTCGECLGCTGDFCMGASVTKNAPLTNDEAHELASIYRDGCNRPVEIDGALANFAEPRPLHPLDTFKLKKSSGYNY